MLSVLHLGYFLAHFKTFFINDLKRAPSGSLCIIAAPSSLSEPQVLGATLDASTNRHFTTRIHIVEYWISYFRKPLFWGVGAFSGECII